MSPNIPSIYQRFSRSQDFKEYLSNERTSITHTNNKIDNISNIILRDCSDKSQKKNEKLVHIYSVSV